MAKRTRKGQKQCPKCDAWVKGTRAKKCPKCGYGFTAAKAKKAARQTVTASSRSPDQGRHCRYLGSDQGGRRDGENDWRFSSPARDACCTKEVGGPKKFKDLLDAIAVSGVGESKPS